MEQQKGNASQIPATAQLVRAVFHERMQQVRSQLAETVDKIRYVGCGCGRQGASVQLGA